jgi:hypothetical protein
MGKAVAVVERLLSKTVSMVALLVRTAAAAQVQAITGPSLVLLARGSRELVESFTAAVAAIHQPTHRISNVLRT